ncbi:hypothetical protein LC55x_3806 [Lysobacter capsici]|nr:hypothetical protein LC55x_3806 [Lysobacter capsici]
MISREFIFRFRRTSRAARDGLRECTRVLPNHRVRDLSN